MGKSGLGGRRNSWQGTKPVEIAAQFKSTEFIHRPVDGGRYLAFG